MCLVLSKRTSKGAARLFKAWCMQASHLCLSLCFVYCYTSEDMRYSPGRTYSLVLHGDAESDLDRLFEEDEDACADIEVFLEEAKNNQDTLDSLTRKGYVQYGDCPFDVTEWEATKKQRYNLWRLKFLCIEGNAAKYRIVYAFHPGEYRYYVLGILHRNFDYDLKQPRSQQIIAAYDALNIPRY